MCGDWYNQTILHHYKTTKMRSIYGDWEEIKQVSQSALLWVERPFEAYVAKKFKEEFPYLTDWELEKYSRSESLSEYEQEWFRRLHRKLREGLCWNCKRELPARHIICEWFFSQDVRLCEHCYTNLLLREWLEDLYNNLLKELKQNDEDTETPQS